MPLPRDDARRSVVPQTAGRSLWLAAIWTGVGAAVVCATLAIVAAAICWLPVSGAHAHPMSAVRAGLLTFLASLHGGVTIDASPTQFVPLGMTCIVALTAWRAGEGLADAGASLDERDPARLAIAAALQAGSFTVAALVAAGFATLGSSTAPILGVGAGALLLFLVAGGTAFVRASALRDWCGERVPNFLAPSARAAGAAVATYLGAGAVLGAGSLVMHASRVEELARQVGGGWGSVPILLLGILAAPNAAIAGAAYLSGAGFTVGSGTSVGVLTSTHGLLPAFPLLGAVPTGHGATWYVWVLVVATALVAGSAVARMIARADGWRCRARDLGVVTLLVAAAWVALSWLGGGGIGTGRLSDIGASWWRAGGLIAAEVAAVAVVVLAATALWNALRGRGSNDAGSVTAWLARADTVVLRGGGSRPAPAVAEAIPHRGTDDEGDGTGKLAG